MEIVLSGYSSSAIGFRWSVYFILIDTNIFFETKVCVKKFYTFDMTSLFLHLTNDVDRLGFMFI